MESPRRDAVINVGVKRTGRGKKGAREQSRGKGFEVALRDHQEDGVQGNPRRTACSR